MFPGDTVPRTSVKVYTQGVKALTMTVDAQTIRTSAKLHDQFGDPSCIFANVQNHWMRARRVTFVTGPHSTNHVWCVYVVNWQEKTHSGMNSHTSNLKLEPNMKLYRIKGFEKLWLGWERTSFVLRWDMSARSHMSMQTASWCDQHGIKLEVSTKADLKLATQERDHAVRRHQLPQDMLKQATHHTLVDVNRLRNVKGDSSIQHKLGFQPHILATLTDSHYRLSEHAAAKFFVARSGATQRGSENQP